MRQLGKDVTVNAEGDLPAKAVADLFPAYDDDGGLLLVLTPVEVGCLRSVRCPTAVATSSSCSPSSG